VAGPPNPQTPNNHLMHPLKEMRSRNSVPVL
jgi:hypothetical protein